LLLPPATTTAFSISLRLAGVAGVARVAEETLAAVAAVAALLGEHVVNPLHVLWAKTCSGLKIRTAFIRDS
jgi:hypothetical protein